MWLGLEGDKLGGREGGMKGEGEKGSRDSNLGFTLKEGEGRVMFLRKATMD